jgi:1,4-alpha-glucan branching enzyme
MVSNERQLSAENKRRAEMIRKDKVNKTKNHLVTFSYKSFEAKQVILAGDFNNWNLKQHPMKKDCKELQWRGTWEKTLMLPEGKYEYKFLVDGEWVIDPQNTQTTHNNFGTQNSIINLS